MGKIVAFHHTRFQYGRTRLLLHWLPPIHIWGLLLWLLRFHVLAVPLNILIFTFHFDYIHSLRLDHNFYQRCIIRSLRAFKYSYLYLVSMLGLVNLILTLLGKINDGDSDKYHMYDSIPSYLLVFFKLVHVIVFVVGLILLYRSSSKNTQIVKFIANFGFMGAIYFFSLPAIMLMANLLPHSSRKQIVFFSV